MDDLTNYLSELPIPYSTLFIFLVNTCVVLIGSLIFRLLIDVDRLEAQEFEVHSYDRSLKEAKRRNDKAALRKMKREEVRIKRISALASKQRLKVVMITVLPFTAVPIFLGSLYAEKKVTLFPFEFLFFNEDSSFPAWYFLTYLAAYLPLSKVFRSSPSFWHGSEEKSG